jgi:hypothetical protein
MKANFNRENWTANLDNEAVKAIRFVLGFNTDLRVRLTTANKESLFSWIQDNEIGIFGFTMPPRPDPTSDEWDKYERMIKNVVRQIVK